MILEEFKKWRKRMHASYKLSDFKKFCRDQEWDGCCDHRQLAYQIMQLQECVEGLIGDMDSLHLSIEKPRPLRMR